MSDAVVIDNLRSSFIEKENSCEINREQWNRVADRCVQIALTIIPATIGLLFLLCPSNSIANISMVASCATYIICSAFAIYAWIQAGRCCLNSSQENSNKGS